MKRPSDVGWHTRASKLQPYPKATIRCLLVCLKAIKEQANCSCSTGRGQPRQIRRIAAVCVFVKQCHLHQHSIARLPLAIQRGTPIWGSLVESVAFLHSVQTCRYSRNQAALTTRSSTLRSSFKQHWLTVQERSGAQLSFILFYSFFTFNYNNWLIIFDTWISMDWRNLNFNFIN